MTAITGENIERYRALVLAKAIKLYAETGMKANTAYTPTAMLRTAAHITGRTYKRGMYWDAYQDLLAFATEDRK